MLCHRKTVSISVVLFYLVIISNRRVVKVTSLNHGAIEDPPCRTRRTLNIETRPVFLLQRGSPCTEIGFYRQCSLPGVNLKIIIGDVTKDTKLVTLSPLAKNTISPRYHREGSRIDLSRNFHEAI
ncbi:hypothetical protein TNCV_4023351 [Trichonephila clavipes]|nr:hypothetical protein TNCV_4023351 [Trichonephila clavipes]